MSIRPATAADVHSISALLHQLGYTVAESKLSWFLRERADYHMRVHEQDGKVVGFISWYVSPYLLTDWERRHIEALVVDEAYRSQGIGKQLVQSVEYAVDKQCVIELLTSTHRERSGTHAFYKHLGFGEASYYGKTYFRKILQ